MTTTIKLSAEQEAFLEECMVEFSERFTDSDVEYKKIYDAGIPKPPIMFPWGTRGRFNNRNFNRDDGRYQNRDHRDYNNRRDNSYGRYRENRKRERSRSPPRERDEKRFRPF